MIAQSFAYDADALYFDEYDGMSTYERPLYAGNYSPSTRLEYLALGDSYSSGEGDVGRDSRGKNYYLQHTDSGKDTCHISSRSYPFLLRDYYHMPSEAMKSVACSGARVVFDYDRPLAGYLGQTNRLQGKKNIEQIKQDALNSFTPGYVPQLEFVKKYQPKVVTLTGGGNDVGFADILTYCASPEWENLVPTVNSDCGYAVRGSELETMLYDAIDTQYVYNKRLIDDMKKVSPDTKIVLIGYPSFVTDKSPLPCVLNSGVLDTAEIQMINRMVDYMNAMLQRVAYDTGIAYVDITESLVGGRVCEGGEYMTGVWSNVVGEAALSERFHPNAEAHKKMAEVIEQADVFNSAPPDNAGTFDPLVRYIATIYQALFAKTLIGEGTSVALHIDSYLLAPGSTYTTTIYSSPKTLGEFKTNADGSADATVSFQGIPPGEHVVVVEGVSPSGEPVKMYQFVSIAAPSDESSTSNGVNSESTPRVNEGETQKPLGSLSHTPPASDDQPKAHKDSAVNEPVLQNNPEAKAGDSEEHVKSIPTQNFVLWGIAALVCIGVVGGVAYAKERWK